MARIRQFCVAFALLGLSTAVFAAPITYEVSFTDGVALVTGSITTNGDIGTDFDPFTDITAFVLNVSGLTGIDSSLNRTPFVSGGSEDIAPTQDRYPFPLLATATELIYSPIVEFGIGAFVGDDGAVLQLGGDEGFWQLVIFDDENTYFTSTSDLPQGDVVIGTVSVPESSTLGLLGSGLLGLGYMRRKRAA